ncbi:MAG: murein biosynthesis integral membrane protein MurJ, partial [Candidatus Hydrogenedentota bacterium]
RDLFFIGLMIPNTLSRLLGEGAFSSGFLPIFSRMSSAGEDDRLNELTSVILNVVCLVSTGLCLIVWLSVPCIYKIFFFLEPRDKSLYPLAIFITRWMVPCMIFIALCAIGMAYLNSRRRFFVPAMASSILNLCLIIFPISASFIPDSDDLTILHSLAIGVFAGGIIQFLVYLITMLKAGFRYTGIIIKKLQELIEGFKRMIPSMIGMSILEINIVIDKILAWLLPVGGISALYYSGHLFNLPLALIGYSVSVASFPEMSTRKGGELSKKVIESKEIIIFGTIPAIAGLISAGGWIIRGLFFGGRFGQWDLQATYLCLLFFSMGIYFHSLYKLLIITFFSIDDTVTPFKISIAGIIINLILNLVLMQVLSFTGLALSTTITGGINVFTAELILKKRGIIISNRETRKFLLKNILISLLMGLVVFGFGYFLDLLIIGLTILKLFVIIPFGILVHYILLRLMGLEQGLEFYKRILSKSGLNL